jgi:toxin ParE1/3/4
MPRVLKTVDAEYDLSEIVSRIAEDKFDAAMKWIDDIEAVFRLLSLQPLMGEVVQSKRFKVLRRHCRGKYVIYYRPLPDGGEIYRVLHGARDHESEV